MPFNQGHENEARRCVVRLCSSLFSCPGRRLRAKSLLCRETREVRLADRPSGIWNLETVRHTPDSNSSDGVMAMLSCVDGVHSCDVNRDFR